MTKKKFKLKLTKQVEEVTDNSVDEIININIRKKMKIEIQSILMDKDKFSTFEDAAKWADNNGFIVDIIDETTKYYIFRQLSRERFIEESIKEHEITSGVIALIGSLVATDDGKTDNKKTDNNSVQSTFDQIKDRIIGDSESINIDQLRLIDALSEKYKMAIADLKEKLNKFIPVLNEFLSISDNLIKDEKLNENLDDFTNAFAYLTSEINKVDVEFEEETEIDKCFEKNIKEIKVIFDNIIENVDKSKLSKFVEMIEYSNYTVDKIIDDIIPIIKSKSRLSAKVKKHLYSGDIEIPEYIIEQHKSKSIKSGGGETVIYNYICPEKYIDKDLNSVDLFDESIKEDGVGTFILQKHTIGEGSHYDLRLNIQSPIRKDFLTGFTIPIDEKINKISDFKSVINKANTCMTQIKSGQPLEWLNFGRTEPFIIKMNEHMSTQTDEALIEAVDYGSWKAGVQDELSKEIFFKSSNGIINGKFLFITEKKSDDSISELFSMSRPEDQTSTRIKQSKRKMKTIDKDLIFWGTQEAIMGTSQSLIMELAKLYDVDRKFVTTEYPEKRFIEYITDNYKVESASYSNLSEPEYHGYSNLICRDKNIDAFVLDGRLVMFFDDKKEIEKILGLGNEEFVNSYFNYEPGSYQIEQGMYGYYLSPIENDLPVDPIFDEDVIDKLRTDTDTFFAKRDFYKDADIPHKRGILLYGPPGNGKTTFIKNYIKNIDNRYAIMVDCSTMYTDSAMFEFLNKELKDKQKIIIFEDVDAVASSIGKRSAFLNFIDGMGQLDNTLIIATTNYPERLDPALLKRTSRFDKKYKIDYPSQESRKKFLVKFFPYINGELLEKYAKLTEGFSGSDFKEIFILVNIQDTSIINAIEQMKSQLTLFKRIQKHIKGEVRDVELFKLKNEIDDKEERVVYGIVLKPNDTDAHKDIYDADTVIKAADFYMEFFGNVGLMHRLIINKKVKILQTYTAPSNFTLSDMKGNKRKVVKDTWLMKVRIIDDGIWKDVKEGKLTGFSIGALATVRELKKILNTDIK